MTPMTHQVKGVLINQKNVTNSTCEIRTRLGTKLNSDSCLDYHCDKFLKTDLKTMCHNTELGGKPLK